GALKKRVICLAHPSPELRAELALDVVETLVARQVVLLERVGLEVVQLDCARPVGRVPRRVGAKDRALLDVARDLDRESRLEVADVLVPSGADAAHRGGIAVERLL